MVRIRKRKDHMRQNKKTKEYVEVTGGYYIELTEGMMSALEATEGTEVSVTKVKDSFDNTVLQFAVLK